MVNRFHINPSSGNVGPCAATPWSCPHGDENVHYLSEEDALQAHLLKGALATIPTAAPEAPGRVRLSPDVNEFADEIGPIVYAATDHSEATQFKSFTLREDQGGRPLMEWFFSTWQGAHLAQQAILKRFEVVATLLPFNRDSLEHGLRVVPLDRHRVIHQALMHQNEVPGHHVVSLKDIQETSWPPRFIMDSNGGVEEIFYENFLLKGNGVQSWIFQGVADRNVTLVVLND